MSYRPPRPWSGSGAGVLILDTGGPARFVTRALLVVTAVIFGAFVVGFGVHRAITPVDELKAWLDIGAEGNLPAWWNSLLLAIASLLGLVSAATSVDQPRERRSWYVIAAAAAYLSIDEATVLHERLSRIAELTDLDPPSYAWLIPGAVLAALGSIILIRVGRALPAPTGPRLGVALGLYALAALGLEGIGGLIRDRWDDSWFFTVVLIAEEGLEVVACILAIGAIVDHLNPRRERRGLVLGHHSPPGDEAVGFGAPTPEAPAG